MAHLRRLARQRPRLQWLPTNMTRRRPPAKPRLQHGSTHRRLCQRHLAYRLEFRRLAQLGLVLALRRRGAVIPTSTAQCRRLILVLLHQSPLKFPRLRSFHGLKLHGPKRNRLHHHLPRQLLLLLLLLLLRYLHLPSRRILHCHRLRLPNLNRILSILDGRNRQQFKRLPGTMSRLRSNLQSLGHQPRQRRNRNLLLPWKNLHRHRRQNLSSKKYQSQSQYLHLYHPRLRLRPYDQRLLRIVAVLNTKVISQLSYRARSAPLSKRLACNSVV